jgi:hypothetical protein
VITAMPVFFKRSDVDKIEGKFACSKGRSPTVDHGRKQSCVLVPPANIGFTLVPDHTFELERNQRRDHPVIKIRRPVVVTDILGSCVPMFQQRFKRIDLVQIGAIGPGFGRRATPGRLDQPNRAIQFGLQLLAKIVGDRGKIGCGLRIANRPFDWFFNIRNGVVNRMPGNFEQANFAVGRLLKFRFKVLALIQSPFHV